MGRLHAEDYAELVSKGEVKLLAALDWHLRCNHYPPVPISFVPVCIKAITLANAGEWNVLVQLPPKCTYRGADKAPVSAIVEQHHLESFLDEREGD